MTDPYKNGDDLSKSLFQRPLVWGIVVLAVIFVAAFSIYSGYISSAGQPPLVSQAAQVQISQPSNAQETDLLSPLSVNAIAAGPSPFLSMELWINGELSGVQAAPSEGKHPFATSFAWLPKKPGIFSLVARAVDKNNQTTTSAAILVYVSSDEDDSGELSAELSAVPAVMPAVSAGYSPPNPPGGDSSAKPGEVWNGSPGDWVNSLSNDTPPNAPELVAEVENCAGLLSIHDFSDNEEGFAIYRQLSNTPNFQKIVTLASNSQTDWITHMDQDAAGGVTYYVSSFNTEGESQSNLAVINIDPVNCPPQTSPQAIPVLAVEFSQLTLIGTSPDMVYCYQSINEGVWTRWPLSGFFHPDEDGGFAQNEIFSLILSESDGSLTEKGFVLNLNCWGWNGPQLEFIGSFEMDNTDLTEDQFAYDWEYLNAEIIYEILDFTGPYQELGPVGDQEFNVGLAKDKVLVNLYPPEMVYVNPTVTYDPDECTSHLMPDAQNLFGTILFCFPYPGFHGGLAEGDNPQPYLIWDPTQQCPAGYGTEDIGGPCKDYEDYLEQANANGGTVGFYIHDNSSAGYVKWTISAPYLQNLTIPPNGCNGARSFFLQMWYQEGNITQTGPVSADKTINCPKPVGNIVTLDFIFESITFNNIDDDDPDYFTDETVEVFGYFQVMAPSSPLGSNNYLKIGTWDDQASECPDDDQLVPDNPPPLGCPQVFIDGSYNLANVPLCKSSDYTQSDKYQCFANITQNYIVGDLFSTNNNKLRVEVQDGDGINLSVVIHDWDDASANDLVCWSFNDELSAGMNNFEWHAIDGQGFGLLGWGEDGMTCSISGVIHVVE